MLRRLALPLALAALLLTSSVPAVADDAAAARQVNAAAKRAKREFKSGAKEAFGILGTASRNMLGQLAAETRTLEETAAAYGPALAQYLHTVSGLAEDAADSVADAGSAALAVVGSDDCVATLNGAGGSLDKFSDSMQRELDRCRARGLKHARRFIASLGRVAGRDPLGRLLARGTVRIRPLVFEFGPAPYGTGTLPQGDRPLRLQMWIAIKLRQVGAVITVSGRADPGMTGQFDVRLSRAGHEPVGDFLRDGGVAVNANGEWATTDTLGLPSFDAGNRVLLLGTEPQDIGAGPDPTRLLQVGVIGVH